MVRLRRAVALGLGGRIVAMRRRGGAASCLVRSLVIGCLRSAGRRILARCGVHPRRSVDGRRIARA